MPVDVLADILSVAMRAPSSHNTQPWRFVAQGDELELHADRTRGLPVNDPDDRELTISCGTCLFTLRVAAAHHGLSADIQAFPDAMNPDLLARVRLVGAKPRNDSLARLYPVVTRRRTHRGDFIDRSLDPSLERRLVTVAAHEGAQLSLVTGQTRDRLAALVAEGDRAQFADRRWRRELASWMHPHRASDGLPVALLALPATRLVVTTIDLGERTGTKDAELIRRAPTVLLLATKADVPTEWLAAGQALQHVLLVAAENQVFAGYANQPCQVGGELRAKVRELLPGADYPQVVLRLGYAKDHEVSTPRRPVHDVLERA